MTVMIDLDIVTSTRTRLKSLTVPCRDCKIENQKDNRQQQNKNHIQTIGMAIQRGNISCILESVLDSRKLDEVYYL